MYSQRQEIDEMTSKISGYRRDLEVQQIKKLSQQQDLAQTYCDKIKTQVDASLSDRVRNRVLYNELCDRYANKELQKDRNYANYYREINNQQVNFQDLHREKVLSPKEKKEFLLDSIIEKNIEETDLKARLSESEKQQRFQQNLSEMALTNRQKIDLELYKRSLNAEERRMKDEARMKELNDYNEFLSQEQQKKRAQQIELKQFLEQQALEQKKLKTMSVSMSPIEKRINYGDLQAYKIKDPSLHAMIPGWSPQIGGMPVKVQDRDLGKTLRIRTEPDPEVRPTGLSLISPKLTNDYQKKIEQTVEKLEQTDKDALDLKYLSDSQLKHLLIYDGQLSNGAQNQKARSPGGKTQNNVTIFSQVGLNSIK